MRQVSESLAGRAVYFVLNPLTLGEINQTDPTEFIKNVLAGNWPKEGKVGKQPPDPTPLMHRGLMPALLKLHSEPALVRWWDGHRPMCR